jgi:hypothetical protein
MLSWPPQQALAHAQPAVTLDPENQVLLVSSGENPEKFGQCR